MSSDNDLAIKIDGVSKCFEMYSHTFFRLLQMFSGKKKFYKEFWALKDISFELKRGESIGILGKNGSGKSTLLQIIARTLSPTSGTVKVNGRVAALLELGSGFSPDFTGRENVYMNASILGLSKEETDQRFPEIEAFADIGDFIDQPVKTYSSGMMVRLAFAVQVMVQPDILIVDEALAVGDARFQLKCFARLKKLREAGTSILFVSHSVDQVRAVCDRALLLDHGKTVCMGDAKTTALRYMQLIFKKEYESPHEQENLSGMPEIQEMPPISMISSGTGGNKALFDKEENCLKFVPGRQNDGKFGVGGTTLNEVRIYGLKQPNVFIGGENIRIRLRYSWNKDVMEKLVKENELEHDLTPGVSLANRKGEYIFGCNGFDAGLPMDYREGTSGEVEFLIPFPFLMKGSYFLTFAFALGKQSNHIQTLWYDYALELQCFPPEGKNIYGTIALPYSMKKISIHTGEL